MRWSVGRRRRICSTAFALHRAAATLLRAWMAAGCSPRDGRVPGVGDAMPGLEFPGRGPALVWVFDARECLGCTLTDPARTVRALQYRLGEQFEVVAVAVGENGDADRDLVAGFLGSQRISARIDVRSRSDYVRAFGRAEPTLFYITNEAGVIEAVVPASEAEIWRSAGDSLDLAGFVQSLAMDAVR